MNKEFILPLIKTVIYFMVFLISFFSSKSILWERAINPKYYREGWIMIVFINIGLSYLVGSFLIEVLMIEAWFY